MNQERETNLKNFSNLIGSRRQRELRPPILLCHSLVQGFFQNTPSDPFQLFCFFRHEILGAVLKVKGKRSTLKCKDKFFPY